MDVDRIIADITKINTNTGPSIVAGRKRRQQVEAGQLAIEIASQSSSSSADSQDAILGGGRKTSKNSKKKGQPILRSGLSAGAYWKYMLTQK